ncbi:MAG: AAA family ATPase [Desulfovibrio sp.]|nr:AAA family ATPase [Desulfovibrio sp.]
MLKLAIYGKGGIGKSTMTANLAAAFATLGLKVIQIGCDPKADSTMTLLKGKAPLSVMDYLREYDHEPGNLKEVSARGFKNILCLETGGPTPGLGCAGRGIITTFQLLSELKLFEIEKPDVVLYDVLGDVVCGGFAAPIREGYAEHVLIVTSGEKMALYAAKNIFKAVQNFASRGYAKVLGLILNSRNITDERAKVEAFARETHLPILTQIPRSDLITKCEEEGMTVLEGAKDSEIAKLFLDLAQSLCNLTLTNAKA